MQTERQWVWVGEGGVNDDEVIWNNKKNVFGYVSVCNPSIVVAANVEPVTRVISAARAPQKPYYCTVQYR